MGKVPGVFIEREHERIKERDFEGGGVGVWKSQVGGREKSDTEVTTDVSRVAPNQLNR